MWYGEVSGWSSERGRRAQVVLVGVGALALLLAVGFSLAPRHLFFFDSVNFALALREFNPALHQPQPPGYPLFVGLTRLLQFAVPRAETVFVLSGAIAGAGAATLIFCLGRSLFGPAGGWLAAVLFVFHPILWFSLLTNQVRTYLALTGTAVALCLWLAWRERDDSRWAPLAGLTLGLGAGFRPALLLYMAPLFAVTLWKRRRDARQCLLSLLLAGAGTLVWLVPTVVASGGAGSFASGIRSYAREQFSGTSLLFGAEVPSAVGMMTLAVAWNAADAMRWLWALPRLLRRARTGEVFRRGNGVALLLFVWFLPAFLFHAFVHVGDPDHVLITVPPVTLAGAWAIAAAFRTRKTLVAAGALAAGLGVLLFFKPVSRPTRMMSYKVVRYVDTVTCSTLKRLDELSQQGPLVVEWRNGQVSWRTISYYFPQVPVVLSERGIRYVVQANRRRRLDDDGVPLAPRTVVVVLKGVKLEERSGQRQVQPFL